MVECGPMPVETVFILGAGFSCYAGAPLQKDFAKDVLRGRDFGDHQPSKIIVDSLEKFVADVFHQPDSKGEPGWPEWEDLFTCLDLSANSGHHLGPNYDPHVLRTIRRAILSRVIRMLDQRYKKALKRKSRIKMRQLDAFLKGINLQTAAFVSLNWDTVLELRLTKRRKDLQFCYGRHVFPAQFIDSATDSRITVVDRLSQDRVSIAKMHGATNWLYCDNCRSQFSFPANTTGSVAMQLMQEKDWRTLCPGVEEPPKSSQWKCSDCGVLLGTRMATFSYRKVLDSPVLLKTWFYAEELLRQASNWVFVGYSLPEADYEFKYLLKRIELSRSKPPQLFLLDKCEETKLRYRKFFGEQLQEKAIYLGSLGRKGVEHLRGLGVPMAPNL